MPFALTVGYGNSTAGQEAGGFAVDRHQVGLGQNLQQVLGLQQVDDGAEVDALVVEEDIDRIAQS